MTAETLNTVVSTKGQVILPKAVREKLQWVSGTRLVVQPTADGVLLKPAVALFAPTRPDDVFGCLPYAGKPKSTEDRVAGVAAEVKRRHARGRY